MAQDSPAKPLLDLRDKLYRAAGKFMSYDKPMGKSTATQKEDTSWHDGMVKQANETFRKQSQKKVSAVESAKPATKKKATRKKISAKR